MLLNFETLLSTLIFFFLLVLSPRLANHTHTLPVIAFSCLIRLTLLLFVPSFVFSWWSTGRALGKWPPFCHSLPFSFKSRRAHYKWERAENELFSWFSSDRTSARLLMMERLLLTNRTTAYCDISSQLPPFDRFNIYCSLGVSLFSCRLWRLDVNKWCCWCRPTTLLSLPFSCFSLQFISLLLPLSRCSCILLLLLCDGRLGQRITQHSN